MSLYNASTVWLVSNGANNLIVFFWQKLCPAPQAYLTSSDQRAVYKLFNSSVRTDVDRSVPVYSAQISGFFDNLGSMI